MYHCIKSENNRKTEFNIFKHTVHDYSKSIIGWYPENQNVYRPKA